jgi:hypothetical protein
MSNASAFAGATLVTIVLVLGAGLVARAGGQGDSAAPGRADVSAGQDDLKGATGDPIVCQDGQVFHASFAHSGDTFVILAPIESHRDGHLTVIGPSGEIDLLTDADVESEFLDGDAVKIEAMPDAAGNLVVTVIEPACPEIEAVEVVTDPAAPFSEPSAVEPAQTAQLLIDELDDDDDDDDDDDHDHDHSGRGHGNHGDGRGGGPHGD